MGGEPKFLRNPKIIIAFREPFFRTGSGVVMRVDDTPDVARIEPRAIGELKTAAIEVVAVASRLGCSETSEPRDLRRELLIEARAVTGSVPVHTIIRPVPDAVVSLAESGQSGNISDFTERVHRLRQVRRLGSALLDTELERETVLR